jgi:hypothetical protein
MAWRFHGKRVEVSAIQPSPFSTCDRCGSNVNHKDLRWQYEWAGSTLLNKRLLVCSRCHDRPSPFLKSLKLPLDPVPVLNARPEPYLIDETDYRVTTTPQIRETEDPLDQPRITENAANAPLVPNPPTVPGVQTQDASLILTSSGDFIVE